MISGDHLATAKSVALAAGILAQDSEKKPFLSMTGDELIDLIGYPEKKIVNGKEVFTFPDEKKPTIQGKVR